MPESTTKMPLVCDTTVLLYLGRIHQIKLLPALFALIYVPEAVALELDMGRVMRSDTLNPRILRWITIAEVPQQAIDNLPTNRLGDGERHVIAYARAHKTTVAGLDDLQARIFAESVLVNHMLHFIGHG